MQDLIYLFSSFLWWLKLLLPGISHAHLRFQTYGETKAPRRRIQARGRRGPGRECMFGAGGDEHQRVRWAGENETQKTTRAESRTREKRARGREGESRFGAGGDEKQRSGTRGRRPARAGAAFVSSSGALRGCTRPMSPRSPSA